MYVATYSGWPRHIVTCVSTPCWYLNTLLVCVSTPCWYAFVTGNLVMECQRCNKKHGTHNTFEVLREEYGSILTQFPEGYPLQIQYDWHRHKTGLSKMHKEANKVL